MDRSGWRRPSRIIGRRLAADPGHVDALNNLGVALKDHGQPGRGPSPVTGKFCASIPNYADAHNNMGVAQRELGRLDEAMASSSGSRSLSVPTVADAPEPPWAWMLQDQGLLADAIAVSLWQQLRLKPQSYGCA